MSSWLRRKRHCTPSICVICWRRWGWRLWSRHLFMRTIRQQSLSLSRRIAAGACSDSGTMLAWEVQICVVELRYIPQGQHVADFLRKWLPRDRFEACRDNVGLKHSELAVGSDTGAWVNCMSLLYIVLVRGSVMRGVLKHIHMSARGSYMHVWMLCLVWNGTSGAVDMTTILWPSKWHVSHVGMVESPY